jgi:uncharacterized membrane protein HdeD (DUF308 family)
MKTIQKVIKTYVHFWWMFVLCGSCLILFGSYLATNQLVTYDELGLFFAAIMIVSGIVELAFCLRNHKWFIGKGWFVGGAIIDLILGVIFGANPILAAISLPLFAGLWLLVRSVVILGRSAQLKKSQSSEWPWLLVWSFTGLFFSLINIYDPIFGDSRLVIWPALSLLAVGIFYVHFGLVIKSSNRRISKHIYT